MLRVRGAARRHPSTEGDATGWRPTASAQMQGTRRIPNLASEQTGAAQNARLFPRKETVRSHARTRPLDASSPSCEPEKSRRMEECVVDVLVLSRPLERDRRLRRGGGGRPSYVLNPASTPSSSFLFLRSWSVSGYHRTEKPAPLGYAQMALHVLARAPFLFFLRLPVAHLQRRRGQRRRRARDWPREGRRRGGLRRRGGGPRGRGEVRRRSAECSGRNTDGRRGAERRVAGTPAAVQEGVGTAVRVHRPRGGGGAKGGE